MRSCLPLMLLSLRHSVGTDPAGLRHAVEDDRRDHDADARLETGSRFEPLDRLPDRAAEPPPAPIIAAMTTMERASIMVWLTPAMMVGGTENTIVAKQAETAPNPKKGSAGIR